MKFNRFRYVLTIFSLVLLIFSNIFVPTSMNTKAHGEEASTADDVPYLLITEILPETKWADGRADMAQYIEVYNNSDQTIDFRDYMIVHKYPDAAKQDHHWTMPDEEPLIMESGDNLVLWLKTRKNEQFGVDTFNEKLGSDLVEHEDIVQLPAGSGMHKNRLRTMTIATNSGEEIVNATYNDFKNIAPDEGVEYTYPVPGSIDMETVDEGKNPATPGVVRPEQVPEDFHPIPEDTEEPTIEDETPKSFSSIENVEFKADATDDHEVKTVSLFYKLDQDDDFTKQNIPRDTSGYFSHKLDNDDLDALSTKYIDYYYVVSDGTHRDVRTDDYRLDISSERKQPELNMKDGDIFNQEVNVKADLTEPDGAQILIDGEEVEDTKRIPENKAYFSLDGKAFFSKEKNALTIGDDIIAILDKIYEYDTETVPVEPEKLVQGENTLTLRAGTKLETYFEDTFEDHESDMSNYWARNIQLTLNDGTILRDPSIDEDEVEVGKNAELTKDLTFDIPDDQATSLLYDWDTTSVSDGHHEIKVVDGDGSETAIGVDVDNTKPKIETSLKDGETSKTGFLIDPEITDNGSGLKTNSTLIKLDDETIEVPYRVSDSTIDPGDHILEITAVDKVGNKNEKTIHFTISDDAPDKPELISPDIGATGLTTPNLSVRVTDPEEDKMDVSFYQASKYNATTKDNITISQGVTENNPPMAQSPEGAELVEEDKYDNLSAIDEKYLVTESPKEFPYQRFEVELDQDVTQDDDVELHWKGNAPVDQRISMYAWHHDKDRWEMIDSQLVDSADDLVLKGDVDPDAYVRDQKVDVLVQDPPEADYDFSFAWMADPQYYSELWPDRFKSIVHWIKDEQESHNIQYLFNSGDIVNEATQEYQWDIASKYMAVIDDAGIPNGVLAGNHDLLKIDGKPRDYEAYSKYFGADRYEHQPYYGGSYKDNRGHYDLISVGGNDFIMVHMGWHIGDEELDWMNKVLAEHPERKAILNFHDYLRNTGERSEVGQDIFDNVVVPNENVIMTLNGHRPGFNRRVDTIDDGDSERDVHQLLSNHQNEDNGGQGHIRMLYFNTDKNEINVETYSPYLDEYREEEVNHFNIDVDLEPQQKRVSTDYFEVNVYGDEEIDTVTDVNSGDTAEIEWSGLDEGVPYSWYASATNTAGAETFSDIWNFTTEIAEVNKAPVIEAEDITITVGDEFEAEDHATAMDPEDGDLTEEIDVIVDQVDPDYAGTYKVTYKVTDSDGATMTKTITVTVEEKDVTDPPADDFEKPVIHAENVTITEGDTFDPLENVTAQDEKENDLTDDIKVVTNDVDPETVGTYHVTYEVTDSRNTAASKEITVTVEEKEADDSEAPETPINGEDNAGPGDKGDGDKLPTTATNMYTMLLIGALLIVVAAGIGIYYRRKKARV